MIYYDFESFSHDWLIVLLDLTSEHEEETVIVNDPEKLQAYFEDHQHDIWTGFNSRHYDRWILKGIVSGICDTPEEVHRLNDWIIVQKNEPWLFSSALQEVKVNNYDVMPNPPVGLKTIKSTLLMIMM